MSSTRREVLYTIGLAAAVTSIPGCTSDGGDGNVATGNGAVCGSNLCFNISDNPDLEAVGGIALFTQATGKKILVQRTDAGFTALSAICTHAGCTVNFNGTDKFNCPCHGSSFNSETGAVINGPAATPLKNFTTTVAGDEVTIAL